MLRSVHFAPAVYLTFALLALGISGIAPADRFTWWLEIAPALVALPILVLTYFRFRFTDIVYACIALHVLVLSVGGHYTYAQVPIGYWLGDLFHTGRNSYDGIGHFMQGFVPALLLRELLLRTSPLRAGKWMFWIVLFCCLGVSALYELVEWGVSVATASVGGSADAFLGTQGDIWDTQKDMALCGVGAFVAQVALAWVLDRQISGTPATAPERR